MSGVFFTPENQFGGLKRGPERPREAQMHVQKSFCDFWWSPGGEMFLFPRLAGPSPCRPRLVCPMGLSQNHPTTSTPFKLQSHPAEPTHPDQPTHSTHSTRRIKCLSGNSLWIGARIEKPQSMDQETVRWRIRKPRADGSETTRPRIRKLRLLPAAA